jgi:sugar phosphate isomerase/epimerase
MNFTRRDFGKIAMATAPAAAGLSIPGMGLAAQSSKFDGVQIGAITYSFRGAPPQGVAPAEMPATMQKIGLSEVELMSGDCEAIAGIPAAPGRGGGGFGGGRGGSGRGPGGGGFGGGRGGAAASGAEVAMAGNGCPANSPSGRDFIAKAAAAAGTAPAGRGGGGRGPATMTPEQEAAQKAIADWKMAAKTSTWKGVKQKFNDAGVDIQILCYNMNLNTKDDEIEYAFQMARDLGVRAISCSTTLTVAKRVAPFADKHKIMWAGHGHFNIYDPEEFATPDNFRAIIALGKYMGVNLDIGHFTQAGFDPMTFIPEIHARITNIHLKDSMKPDKCGTAGPTQPWGMGQTPIKDVLLLMKKNKYTFPANIELEYRIPQGSDSATEVGKCLAFAKNCFA